MGQKIIIRTPNHLGDCVLALPMINETREAYPGSTLSILVPEKFGELFENNSAIDRIRKFPDRHAHGLAGVFKLREFIKDEGFDLGYVLPPSFSSASVFKLAGVKERIGYISDGRRLLLTKPLPLPAPINSSHRSETYFNLLRRTVGSELNYVKPKIFLSDEDINHGQNVLKDFGLAEGEKFVVIAFRSVGESRRWGVENYTELTKRIISETNFKVVLVGLDVDRPEGEIIAAAAGASRVYNLSGKTRIRELSSILSQSTMFIGNDSGVAHLAAAVGTAVLVLSGADDPKETSPLASKKKLIYLSHLDCISCVKNKCPLTGNSYMQCMRGISVEIVIKAFNELISEN